MRRSLRGTEILPCLPVRPGEDNAGHSIRDSLRRLNFENLQKLFPLRYCRWTYSSICPSMIQASVHGHSGQEGGAGSRSVADLVRQSHEISMTCLPIASIRGVTPRPGRVL